MEDLYSVLKNPSMGNLHLHSIDYFDKLVEKYPHDFEKIISYINDCFNYHSPLILEEKDWGYFLMERYNANHIPEDHRKALMEYECPDIVFSIASFLSHQKQPAFTTLVAKQNLRQNMLVTIQSFTASISDKKSANELLTNLDNEINDTYERLRQDQKKFGNYKGYDAVKSAKNKHKINIANFID